MFFCPGDDCTTMFINVHKIGPRLALPLGIVPARLALILYSQSRIPSRSLFGALVVLLSLTKDQVP